MCGRFTLTIDPSEAQETFSAFNFPQPSLTDGTDSLRPATLRGLAPDQVLVLVNGKRRHLSSLLNLNGSVGRRDILLEDDEDRAREAVPQAREGLRRLLEADVVVAAGLSLASRLDKALLSRLAGKRGGRWLVVNHDAEEVRRACEELSRRLPGCSVHAAELPFDAWVRAGFPGLNIAGERAA